MASGKEPRGLHHLSSSKPPPSSIQPLTKSSGLPRRYESKVTGKGAKTKRLVGGKRRGLTGRARASCLPPQHTRAQRQHLSPTSLPKAAWVTPETLLASESRAHGLLVTSLPRPGIASWEQKPG